MGRGTRRHRRVSRGARRYGRLPIVAACSGDIARSRRREGESTRRRPVGGALGATSRGGSRGGLRAFARRMYHTLRPAKQRSCADQAPRFDDRIRLLVPHALRRERSLAPDEVRARQGLQGQESFIRSARVHQIPPGHGAADLAAAAPVEARPVPEQRRAVTVPFSVYRVDGV